MSVMDELQPGPASGPTRNKITISQYLTIEEECIDNAIIVRPEGAIYIPEAEHFDHFMKNILERQQYRLIINFQKVKQLPSLVFATIIQTYKSCQAQGGDLRLCSIPPTLMRVFITMQFDRIFAIFKNEADALMSFHK
ncbi:STAS domain-containing protein [bacterium]|nr:STAS domain-containing protein [bacterium]